MSADTDEIKREKSEQLAGQIILLKSCLQLMDEEYLEQASKDAYSQASWEESAMVLNPSPSFVASTFLREMGKSLSLVHSLIQSLRECERLKKEMEVEKEEKEELSKLFMRFN